jgi:hypothetical protein
MRDIIIPASLRTRCLAKRRRRGKNRRVIILGQAEVEIAGLFHEAAKSYHDN